jgi:hypothetical protein
MPVPKTAPAVSSCYNCISLDSLPRTWNHYLQFCANSVLHTIARRARGSHDRNTTEHFANGNGASSPLLTLSYYFEMTIQYALGRATSPPAR